MRHYLERDRDNQLLRAARVLAALQSVPPGRLSQYEKDNCVEDLRFAIRTKNFRLIEALLLTAPYNWVV